MLTKAEIKIIDRNKDRIYTALYQDYARNVSRGELEQLKAIFDKHTDQDYPLNYGCSSCQLSFLKTFGHFIKKEGYEL